MIIKLVPGTRNEELIAKMKELRENDYDKMYEYFYELIHDYGESVAYDTLYYACEYNDEILENLTFYFQYLIFDKWEYYYKRMTSDIAYVKSLEDFATIINAVVEEGYGYAARCRINYHGLSDPKEVIFAIQEHSDG